MFRKEDQKGSDRLIIGIVVLIGMATMVFGFLNVRKSIFSPFLKDSDTTYKTQEQRKQEALEALKEMDTDNDSLSDYDELYVFRTNPYLADTDSDGIEDGQEVSENTDPNCPKGKSCQAPAVSEQVESPSGEEAATSQEEIMAIAFIQTFGDPSELTRAEAEARVGTMTSEELRQFFVRMGVPQEAVDAADDDTLRKLALEALKEVTFVKDYQSETE